MHWANDTEIRDKINSLVAELSVKGYIITLVSEGKGNHGKLIWSKDEDKQ